MLHQCINEGVVGGNIRSFAKDKMTVYSALPSSYVIVEGCQVSWAWCALHKTVMTTSDHLLVLQVFGHDSQRDLVITFPGVVSEAD